MVMIFINDINFSGNFRLKRITSDSEECDEKQSYYRDFPLASDIIDVFYIFYMFRHSFDRRKQDKHYKSKWV